jgi:hypothetical protein
MRTLRITVHRCGREAPGCYVVRAETGREMFLQFESCIRDTASDFGWGGCGGYAGALAVLDAAVDAGTSILDPGYFD